MQLVRVVLFVPFPRRPTNDFRNAHSDTVDSYNVDVSSKGAGESESSREDSH